MVVLDLSRLLVVTTIKQWCIFCRVEKIEKMLITRIQNFDSHHVRPRYMFGRYQLPIWHQVSGVLLHFPGRVYGLCLHAEESFINYSKYTFEPAYHIFKNNHIFLPAFI